MGTSRNLTMHARGRLRGTSSPEARRRPVYFVTGKPLRSISTVTANAMLPGTM